MGLTKNQKRMVEEWSLGLCPPPGIRTPPADARGWTVGMTPMVVVVVMVGIVGMVVTIVMIQTTAIAVMVGMAGKAGMAGMVETLVRNTVPSFSVCRVDARPPLHRGGGCGRPTGGSVGG